MRVYFLIALGGALGSVLRHFVFTHVGGSFPWGTLLINASGSFAIGVAAALLAKGHWYPAEGGRLFFMTGICGGYTTFSAFSLQTLNLAREGEWGRAGAYVAASVIASLAAVWIGFLTPGILGPSR